MVPRSCYHTRCRHSCWRRRVTFAQRQSARETKLDGESRNCFANGGDCVGHVAATFSSPALRCHRRRRVHVYLRNCLRHGWGATVAGRRPCARNEILSSALSAMNGPNKSPNVAIVGRPNVGKSALFNRLVGRKIAIVHDQPGITRDRISAICSRGEQPFTVWDTGGIFGAGEKDLVAQVRQTADQALHASDLLLFVVDAKDGLSPIDQDLARALRRSRKPIVLVVNKIDNDKHEPLAAEFDSLGFEKIVSISAEHNRGISDLLGEIDQLLPSPAQSVAQASPQPSLVAPERSEGGNLDPQPIRIAIIGRPNVGKSSLINSIVQSDRAIVSELPGTTRDSADILYESAGRQFLFIDTAGMRRRGKLSSSVEVFSVMRAERSIQRADLCVLIVDLTSGVTAQDKRIAGLIQEARKGALVVLNKWDLVKSKRGGREKIRELADEARERIFFLNYAPVLVASARTG